MRNTYRDLKKMRKTWHDNLNETPTGFQDYGSKGREGREGNLLPYHWM